MKKIIINWLLGNQIDQLWSTQSSQDKRLADLEKKIEKLRLECPVYQYNTGHKILEGLLNYLGVKWKRVMVPDPVVNQPRPIMTEIVEVYKEKEIND